MTPATGPRSAESPSGGAFAVELPVFTGSVQGARRPDPRSRRSTSATSRSRRSPTAFLAHAKEAGGLERSRRRRGSSRSARSLLELKVGRLMPRHGVVDEEDLLGVSPDLVVRAVDRARGVPDGRGRDRAGGSTRRPAVHAATPARAPEFAHLYPDVLEDVTAERPRARIAAVVLRPPPLLDLSHVTPIRYTMAEAVEAVPGPTWGGSGRRRSATWWRTATTGSRSWCGSSRSSSCTVRARSTSRRRRRSARSTCEWKGEAA